MGLNKTQTQSRDRSNGGESELAHNHPTSKHLALLLLTCLTLVLPLLDGVLAEKKPVRLVRFFSFFRSTFPSISFLLFFPFLVISTDLPPLPPLLAPCRSSPKHFLDSHSSPPLLLSSTSHPSVLSTAAPSLAHENSSPLLRP